MINIIVKKNLTSIPLHFIFFLIVCFIFVAFYFTPRTLLLPHFNRKNNTIIRASALNLSNETEDRKYSTTTTSRTLVVYVFAKTHVSSEQNLAFFIRTAVRQSHDADYYFILQKTDNKMFDETKLPILPSNAHYIQHENKCFDTGTFGWFLSSGMIDKSKYKYIIFLNSSVRGPFIVSYYDSLIWYTIFTRRLNDHIKLVGCTINCEIAPHVQSYLWAFNSDTFDFLLKNTSVFTCHATKDDAINKAEIVASQMILKSGYGIDSLMRKYQGVDFRLNVSEKCMNATNPTFNNGVNGITLDPYEVVFVKTKDGTSPYHDNFERVRVYENWIH